MTWFRADDGLPHHRKVRRLGKDKLAAMGLWTLSGCWSSGPAQSGGFIPAEIVRQDDPKERLARRLVEVGLWKEAEEDGERGYRFHDWQDFQPSVEQVLDKREKRRAAGRLGGLRSAQARASSKPEATEQANGEANASSTREARASSKREPRPVPSLPTTSGAAAPPAAISAGTVVAAWVEAATTNGIKPTGGMRGQVGKLAGELLKLGNDPALVLAAAEQAGRRGYATIDRELAAMAGRPKLHAIPAGGQDPTSGRLWEQ